MAADVSSAILRFRDLNVPDGQTIEEHLRLIGTDGSVWWGWWAQLNERIADESMRLLEALSRDGLTLYLADSGQKKLYRAHCVEVTWQHTNKAALSPNKALTPQYYVERPCLAWFRFDRIELEPDADVTASLHALSYVSDPALFTDPDEPYTAFSGKQVSSLEELFLQRRTLWFVRPNAPQDPIHEIRLVGADSQEPHDFAPTFLESRGATFLWLSDLHYSRGGHHAFPLEPTKSGDAVPLAEALNRALSDLAIEELAGVFVSGDLTWRAEDGEFELAEEMLRQVASRANIKNISQRLGVAPGNHDIRFSDAPDDPSAQVTVAPDVAREPFAAFYRRLFNRHPNEFLSSGRKFLVGRSLPVEVVFLNSSVLDQIPQPAGAEAVVRFQGQGYLGEHQLRAAAEAMKWDATERPGRVIRIAVLHHHLLPVAHSEPAKLGGNYSVVLDAGRLMSWLVTHRVDVVLHGHQHEPFVARAALPNVRDAEAPGWHQFYVVGMGSTGVAEDHLPPDTSNVFAILSIVDGSLELSTYSIDPVVPMKLISRIQLNVA
jgi:3',5'-cyclic AMP phosphodiesterase CpdA